MGHSLLRLLVPVDGNADHHLLAHTLAHLRGGHIVLPHMDALGMAGYTATSTLSLMNSGTPYRWHRAVISHGLLQKIVVVQLLFPQLHTGDTALQGAFHLLIQGLLPTHARSVTA